MKIAYLRNADVTVWENPHTLQSFLDSADVSGTPRDHAADAPVTEAAVAWWTPDRSTPTIDEAQRRLEFLGKHGPSPYAFAPQQPQTELWIERVWLDNADVQLLIAQLNSDLYSRYPEPGALIFSLHPEDITDGVGTLLMAVHEGVPVGCGAFRVIDDQPGTAEIKRMYVALRGRGHKIGAAMLVELERRAREIGVRRFVLEAGPRQPEALHRYGQAGYVQCEPWGEFVGKDFSICMEKVSRDEQPPSTAG